MKSSHLLAGVLACALPLGLVHADVSLKSDKEKVGYAVGLQIGQDMMNRGIDLDADALAAAIEDVQKGKKPRLSEQEITAAFQTLQKQQMEKAQTAGRANQEAGDKFLAENKKRKGVTVLASGVQYEILTKGTGASPSPSNSVVAHYRGTLINGKEFDSSYGRGEPATFRVNGVIAGWQEILPMMKVGGKWKVYIPADKAYGERGAGGDIGPNEALIFEIELVDIK
jgi:FKBP-type peptidyl-prolyl cis-trans isomerase FklB